MPLYLVAAALAVALASPATAAELSISFGGEEREPVSAKLSAHPLGGRGEPITIENVIIPGKVTVPVGEGTWGVRIEADGIWAPLVVARKSDVTVIRVWPTVPLSGETNVSALRVDFTLLTEDGVEGEVTCPVAERRWTCHLPPGIHDLRFSSPNHAPEIRSPFTVAAKNGPLRLTFIAGASLSGNVTPARGIKTSTEGVEVALSPAGVNDDSTRVITKTDAKGFFQFKGVSPGDYTLRARKDGLTTRTEAVTVIESVAAELAQPLLLDRPKRLTVLVMPSRDPSGKPWRVELLSEDKRANRLDAVSESTVSDTGEWSHAAVVAGDYRVTVSAASGGHWKTEFVSVQENDVTLPVSLAPETISGRIMLGDRPLEAKLSFGGENGPALRSDEHGRFVGAIAPTGAEELEVLVHATIPNVRRSVTIKPRRSDSGALEADIRLPATTLMGRVVHEDGSSVASPFLKIASADDRVVEFARGSEDGTFQVAGLEPGDYRIKAETPEHETKPASIALSPDTPAEVTLVAQRVLQVRGRMVVGNRPVIEANVWAIERDTWHPFVRQARTDTMGRFALRLAPGTTVFDVLAVHPAFDVIMARAKVEKGMRPVVRVRQIGGTLTVDSSTDDLVIRHDGAELDVQMVAQQAGGTLAPGRITIPRLEAGEYSVCGRKSGKCASGYVPPHGTLTLAVE